MKPTTNRELKDIYKTFAPFIKEKKAQKYSTIFFTLTALSLFGVFAINPTISTIAHLQKQLSDNKFIEEKLQEKIESLNTLQNRYALLEDVRPTILNAIPKKPTVPLFAAQLQSVAQANNINIARLQIFQVEISNNTNNTNSQKNYGSFGFTLDLKGTQNNLNSFLSSLVDFERIISIDTISFGSVKEKDNLQISLQGKAYFKP
ncbi:MAG: type 4a pilus biogenesis protein PilO [Candidatus Levyibacteriota bacterium]|nr:MAG: type 4a pilus biogenesis protein PilO [Candidatus Levybacteria bacterium]